MKLVRIALAAATLAAAPLATFDSASAMRACYGPWTNHCIRGIVIRRHCVRWEIFGGERHCVRWAPGW